MASELSNVSHLLVSATNPARAGDGLDYDRCAALHNHIVELGWLGSGRSLDELDRRSWSEVHGDDADEARGHMSPDLAAFLERAYVATHSESFFYWVQSLNWPDGLWTGHIDMAEEGEEYNILTLYTLNFPMVSHPDGLLYDQGHATAIMRMSIMDENCMPWDKNPRKWQPLETVLTAWIEMIDCQKMTPSPEDHRADNEKFDPWTNNRFGAAQVGEAVDAFSALVEAIQSRIDTTTTHTDVASAPLLDAQALLDAGVGRDSFAFAFCTRATRPAFRFVAPGLRVPEPSTFAASQAFLSIPPPTDSDSYLLVPPVLLFSSADSATHTISDDERPFDYIYHDVKTMPAGLYVPDANLRSSNVSEASGRLVLPFSIGDNHLARKSDNGKFNNATSLYELGYPPYGGDPRAQRLCKIFDSWRNMVEQGDWQVGAEGVAGAVDQFKDADSEQWEKYWIAPTW